MKIRTVITGDLARQIRSTVASTRLTADWTEVALSDCDHGCKVWARRSGAVVLFAILHSDTYGCARGRNQATAVESVRVETVRESRAVPVHVCGEHPANVVHGCAGGSVYPLQLVATAGAGR